MRYLLGKGGYVAVWFVTSLLGNIHPALAATGLVGRLAAAEAPLPVVVSEDGTNCYFVRRSPGTYSEVKAVAEKWSVQLTDASSLKSMSWAVRGGPQRVFWVGGEPRAEETDKYASIDGKGAWAVVLAEDANPIWIQTQESTPLPGLFMKRKTFLGQPDVYGLVYLGEFAENSYYVSTWQIPHQLYADGGLMVGSKAGLVVANVSSGEIHVWLSEKLKATFPAGSTFWIDAGLEYPISTDATPVKWPEPKFSPSPWAETNSPVADPSRTKIALQVENGKDGWIPCNASSVFRAVYMRKKN